jgi:ABC-2 type transport system ATP-binding protein
MRRLDLVAHPALVFLDEPTTGLDLPSRQAMWQVVTGLRRSGITVFLTTQYLEEADRLADRLAVIDGGRVVADDTPGSLKEQFAERRLELTLADREAFDSVLTALGDAAVRTASEALTVSVATDGSAPHVRHLLDRLDPDRTSIRSFAIQTATLDDVFLALTGHPPTTSGSTPHTTEAAGV